MNKLDELIKRLCPDGVEYFKVETICNISRGCVMSKNYLKNNKGKYPVYSSQTENDGKLGEISTYKFDGEYITWTTDGAHAGSVFYRYGKFSITNICGILEVKEKSKNLVKYIYYILKLNAKKYVNKGMGNPKLMSNVMGSIKIPIPPLEVQEEIVHILDSFTSLTLYLTENLNVELISRKKQYEYYRDKLLAFGDRVEWKNLEDVCELIMGTSPKGSTISGEEIKSSIEFHQGKTFFSNSVLNYSNLYTTSPIKIAEAGSILMSVRAPVGDVNMTNRKVAIGRGLCSIVCESELNTKFLYYFISANKYEIKKRSNGSTFESINTNDIKSIKIPIPTLEEQERIVSILDSFDKLCNDLMDVLSAEICAIEKQYEYYRDKLLTF